MSATPVLMEVPLDEVYESEWNPRRHFDSHAIVELAESIRSAGQLTPGLARPRPGGGYELAAGHRRRRAIAHAGLDSMLLIIREMDDETFLRTLVLENQDREDLHPLDEAYGFERLLVLPGYDVAAVAEAVGKSRSYVYGRLHLTRLIEDLQQRFLAGEIPVTHALLLARLTPAQQESARERLFDWQGDVVGISLFRERLQNLFYVEMSEAVWDLEDRELVPEAGACAGCPKRTATNHDLFADVATDECTDVRCFDDKRRAFIAREIETSRKAGQELVQLTSQYGERPKKNGAIPRNLVTPAKKSTPGAVEAIDERGERSYVVLSKAATDPKPARPTSGSGQQVPQAIIAGENVRRLAMAREIVAAIRALPADDVPLESITREMLAGMLLVGWEWTPDLADWRIDLWDVYDLYSGTDGRSGSDVDDEIGGLVSASTEYTRQEQAAYLVAAVLRNHGSRLELPAYASARDLDEFPPNWEWAARVAGIDFAALKQRHPAVRSTPPEEPKKARKKGGKR